MQINIIFQLVAYIMAREFKLQAGTMKHDVEDIFSCGIDLFLVQVSLYHFISPPVNFDPLKFYVVQPLILISVLYKISPL